MFRSTFFHLCSFWTPFTKSENTKRHFRPPLRRRVYRRCHRPRSVVVNLRRAPRIALFVFTQSRRRYAVPDPAGSRGIEIGDQRGPVSTLSLSPPPPLFLSVEFGLHSLRSRTHETVINSHLYARLSIWDDRFEKAIINYRGHERVPHPYAVCRTDCKFSGIGRDDARGNESAISERRRASVEGAMTIGYPRMEIRIRSG